VLVGETPWRFKSSPGHHKVNTNQYLNRIKTQVFNVSLDVGERYRI